MMKLVTGRPLQLPLISLQRDPSEQLERFAGVALPVLSGIELVIAITIFFAGRWSRWLALLVMLAFAAVLVPHIRADSVSCGCFGSVQSSPKLMLITSLCAAALIVLLPCAGTPPMRSGPRLTAIGSVASIVIVAVCTLTGLPEQAGWRVPTMRLRPETWVGRPLADLPFYQRLEADSGTNAPTVFGEERQTWVLWLRTCPHCHEYFRDRWNAPTDQRIVAVEIPPSSRGVSTEQHSLDCPSCIRLHLKAGVFYFLPSTPVVLTVEKGVVKAADVNPSAVSLTPQELP